MLAVVKAPPMPVTKEPVSFQIKGQIPECVISVMRSLFKHVELRDDDELIDLDDSPVMNRIAQRMTPGKTVKADRELRGWTQKTLSEMLGLSVQNLSEIKRDRRNVSKKMAVKLAAVFDVHPENNFDFGMVMNEKPEAYKAKK